MRYGYLALGRIVTLRSFKHVLLDCLLPTPTHRVIPGVIIKFHGEASSHPVRLMDSVIASVKSFAQSHFDAAKAGGGIVEEIKELQLACDLLAKLPCPTQGNSAKEILESSDWGLGLDKLSAAMSGAADRLCSTINKKGLPWIKSLGTSTETGQRIQEQLAKVIPNATNYMKNCATTLDLCSGSALPTVTAGGTWGELIEALPQYFKIASADIGLLETISFDKKKLCESFERNVDDLAAELLQSTKQCGDQMDDLLAKYRRFFFGKKCKWAHGMYWSGASMIQALYPYTI